MTCKRCGGATAWDDVACARLCALCGAYDYALVDGATLPSQHPPGGHVGIDFNRGQAVARRATKSGKLVSASD